MAAIKINVHKYVFFRKDFVNFEDAKISIMTHGFLYGTAIFEGIRAYYNQEQNKIYLLEARAHLERLFLNSKILRMNTYYDIDQMLEKTIELIKLNQPRTDAYIRPSWFKDVIRIGPSLIGGDNEDSFVISSLDLGDYLDTSKGIAVSVSSFRRISDNAIPARAKINGSYVNTALAKASAQLAGFEDTIFLTESGHVAEGSAMNLFIIREGKLITSPVSEDILEGITRSFVIEIAQKELNLEVEIRNIDRSELYIADEIFFCGTGAQIVAVGSVDHYSIGDQGIGKITKQIQELYINICRGNVSKYKDKLIEISY